ncbi:hypothetical protein [Flavobacterium soli]|uniref:hypothetical protein n=1 Tax=Flavobacterium soli TaxID=344881 RepID=UPI0003FDF55E|nr:hypothetical protein [Flavobacterium soli]
MRTLFPFAAFLFLLISCSPEEEYSYEARQSEIVEKFRTAGYHEYHSKLNDLLFAELNSLENDLLPTSTLETIAILADKLKEEKNTAGCYVIEWESQQSDPHDRNAIILEWNPKEEVIIRMFMKSSLVRHRLPSNSY